MPQPPLTATDFYRYITCPHWPWLERFATDEERALKRALTTGEERRLDGGYLHEQEVMKGLMQGRSVTSLKEEGSPEALFKATLHAMQQGVEVIYQGTLIHGDWHGRPDLLIKEDGVSILGNWHYVPVDIKSAQNLKITHRLQLSFYAQLLKRIQGVLPEKGAIINREAQWLWLSLHAAQEEFEGVLADVERLRAGERPPCVLRKACMDTSPWGAVCQRQAEQADDIALLYNVDIKKLKALRSLGIHTVEQAASLHTESLTGAAPGLTAHVLEVVKLQAQSLRTKTVFIKEPMAFPSAPLEIYFDIESDLPNDMDYLYGFLLRSAEGTAYHPVVAEQVEDEPAMWKAFLAWLETLPADYVVYHYAPYEPMRLKLLTARYGGSPALDRFIGRFLDLKPLATKRVTYPLYFYGLKYICKSLGFRWTGALQSGGESIDWYERWCETGDRSILTQIIQYNEDDVRATLFLKDWLTTYAAHRVTYDPPYPWKKEA